MPFVADLHVHSRYSRACSRDCDLEHLAWWAARKGIALIGTGDLCHPAWAEQIRTKLVPAEPGLFRLRPDLERDVLATLPGSVRTAVRFQLSVEISTIYKRGEKTRKVHHLLYAPDLGVADELTRRLARIGNLGSDGRPILGLDSRDLLETLLDSGEGGYLVPAHVWTPWFAALGSKSGFDSVADCYADLAGHIFAVETGLSSDPAMNHRVSSLDRYRLVSNSDAHSPPALGREATVLSCDLTYEGVRRALETGAGLDGTIEFFPEEGKYHLDGHRTCDVRLEPGETRSRDGRCPVCAKPVTIGVLHRVEALADRPAGYVPSGAPGWRCLVQLPQVVGELLGVGAKAKSVEVAVARLVDRFGPELSILQDVPLDAVAEVGPPGIGEALRRLRSGEVVLAGGYDGEYGVVRLFDPKEVADLRPGTSAALFDLPTPRDPPPAPPDIDGGGHLPGRTASMHPQAEQSPSTGDGGPGGGAPGGTASVLRPAEQSRSGGDGGSGGHAPAGITSVHRLAEQSRSGGGDGGSDRGAPAGTASVLHPTGQSRSGGGDGGPDGHAPAGTASVLRLVEQGRSGGGDGPDRDAPGGTASVLRLVEQGRSGGDSGPDGHATAGTASLGRPVEQRRSGGDGRPGGGAPGRTASLGRLVEQGRSGGDGGTGERGSGGAGGVLRPVEQSRSGGGGSASAGGAEAGDGLFAAPERMAPVVPVPAAPASVLDGLDPEQRAAAEAGGPLLVVAGPGTGKTRALTTRIAYQIGELGIPAEHHLALTFTRRAAGELTERLAALLPAPPLVTTFHGLGLRIIREHAARLGLGEGVRVVDEAERLALAREAMGADAPAREVRRLLDHVSALARDPAAHDPELAGPLARYRAGKRARGLVDLDDLLARPVALLTEDPDLAAAYRRQWRHVSVDEYQDVDPAQYALLRLLVPADGDLCVIGDPDQAIYSFRGAEVGFFLRFAEDFPDAREVQLTRNYRSTATVVDAALAVVAPATLVPGRTLTAVAGGDGPAHVTLHTAADEAGEAAFVVSTIERVLGGSDLTALLRGAADPWTEAVHSYADFAILYRTDAQSAALVDALEAAGVPYQKRSHHRLGDQPGVRELLSVLREDLVRAAGDPRPVLARVRAAAQVAIDRAGGLPLGVGADEWSSLTPATARSAARAQAAAIAAAPATSQTAPGQTAPGQTAPGQTAAASGQAASGQAASGQAASGHAAPSQAADQAAADQAAADRAAAGQAAGGGASMSGAAASGAVAASGSAVVGEAGADQRVGELRAAVELLGPLAERAGADAGRFLADLALGAEVDLWDPRADRVSLLTLHAAKGLEFPVVFVVGCEDGLLPMRFGDEPVDAAEERRLLFVGMTRARTHLALSGARRRTVRGRLTEPAPSPYLADLPAHLVERTSRPGRRRTVQLRLL